MKMDLIPTVQSLLKQEAIRIEGNIELIEAFDELIQSNSFQYKYPPTFEINGYPFAKDNRYYPPSLSDSIERALSQQVLYSIKLLPEKFEVLIHFYSVRLGKTLCTTKPVYTVISPNLSELDNALQGLYNYIDQSTHFVICQACQKLVAAELCGNGICGSNQQGTHCEVTYKQHFDCSLVDRISIIGEIVNVYKDQDEIKFYISSTAWPHPHQPQPYNRIIETLPLTATLDEVHELREKLETEQKYPALCFHCKKEFNEGQAMDLAYLVDFDTDEIICHGCATIHYGVVY